MSTLVKILIGIIFFIILLEGTTKCQMSVSFQDVSKPVKKIFYGDESIQFNFLGATLSSDSILHITSAFNQRWVISWVDQGVSETNVRYQIALDLLYKYARQLIKQFPNAKRIKIYFAEITDLRDKYGNHLQDEKKILCRLELKKETIEKINWEFVKNELKVSILKHEMLVGMLDDSYFDPQYFQ